MIKKAHDAGVPVIDYDRLTLGGGADYYVSFDNVAVGTAHRRRPRQVHEGDNGDKSGPVALLNGSPTDNNATLFKQGYDKVIKDAGYTVAADQAVPDWDNTKAGTIFEQMYTKANGKFVGVASANDGLGGAVVAVLTRNGDAGKIPVTGQDATDEGLQRVLLGTQCMTVYKAVKKEADAASELASRSPRATRPAADALATRHRRGHRDQASRSSPCCCSRRPIYTDRRQGRHRRRLHQGVGPLHDRRAEEGAARSTGSASPTRTMAVAATDDPAGTAAAVPAGHQQELRRRARPARRRPRRYPGRVTALVGDNGAGKSTLIKGDRRHPPLRRRRDTSSRAQPIQIHGPKDGQRARHRGRLPGPRAVRQPRRRPQHVPRPRDEVRHHAGRDRRWSSGRARR